MVGSISNLSVPNINYTAVSTGKMTIPVSSSLLVFSHLEHVSGVPAPEGTQGVAINKLHLLDMLIERLNQVKSRGMTPNPETRSFETQYLDATKPPIL